MPKMWSKSNPLDYERLLELLRYDPKTGIFYWRIARSSYGGKARAGSIAGRLDKHGYRYIGIDRGMCQAHTLAWVYIYKQWPSRQIDHRNMMPDDNRISNLREASLTQQRANQVVRRDSKSGIKGVQLSRNGRYRARIRKDGIVHNLGYYETSQDALMAYEAAAITLFGEFARTS